MTDFWTADDHKRTRELVQLHAEGRTMSEIGDVLGCSRNAAIGKAYRLRLSGRKSELRAQRIIARKVKEAGFDKAQAALRVAIKPGPKTHPKVARPQPSLPGPITSQIRSGTPEPKLKPRTAPVPYIPPAKIQCDALDGVALLDLRDRHCRFPLGDPGTPEFRFCGKRKAGKTYCAAHARIAYIPPEQRKRRAA